MEDKTCLKVFLEHLFFMAIISIGQEWEVLDWATLNRPWQETVGGVHLDGGCF